MCDCKHADAEEPISYVVATADTASDGVSCVSGGASAEQKMEMNSRPPYMGIHLHLDGKSADDALAGILKLYPEITDVQIFTHGPRGSRPTTAFDQFASCAAKNKVRIWTHGSYLCVPWKSYPLAMHTVDNIRASYRLGSGCTVAHIPFAKVDSVVSGIATVVKQMRSFKMTDTKLMLETSATIQDDLCSYESPAKLNRLTHALFAAGLQDCVRICVDTAHIFAGRARISSYEDASSWWKDLDTRLIGMIHLNGSSRDPDKSRGDKHEVPTSDADLIWGPKCIVPGVANTHGWRAFVSHSRRLGIPMILEVSPPPRHSSSDIRKFISMTKT